MPIIYCNNSNLTIVLYPSQHTEMPHFTPKRIFGYVLSTIFMAIAGWACLGIMSDFHEWLWLRNASEANIEELSYEHGYVGTGKNRQRRTTFSYTYYVEGKRYTRSTRHLGPFVNHYREADRIIETATRGDPVTCYFRLDSPGNALLSRNVSSSLVWISAAFATGFGVAGSCILVGCVSKRYAHQFV